MSPRACSRPTSETGAPERCRGALQETSRTRSKGVFDHPIWSSTRDGPCNSRVLSTDWFARMGAVDDGDELQDRFRDPLVALYDLAAHDVYVGCPGCGDRAVVAAQQAERRPGDSKRWARRLTRTGARTRRARPAPCRTPSRLRGLDAGTVRGQRQSRRPRRRLLVGSACLADTCRCRSHSFLRSSGTSHLHAGQPRIVTNTMDHRG